MFVDTHAHLDDEKYNSDRDEVIKRAKSVGVEYIVNVGTDLETNNFSLSLVSKYDNIYTTIGIHPHKAKDSDEHYLEELEKLLTNDKVVAIGETGLDYFRNLSSKEQQKDVFIKLIQLAHKYALPLSVHSREANNDVLSILKKERAVEVGGVLHCFSGDKYILQECLKLGFYVAVGGTVTYPNAVNLREAVKDIPLYRLLLETDCPYLPPQSKRGSRNEPAYIIEIAKKIADTVNTTISNISYWSKINSQYLFKIGIRGNGRIVYQIGNSLYLNITNRCSNHCTFCARNDTDFVKGHNLRLKKEPTSEEVLKAIGNPRSFKEIVFCGYGEPLIRLSTVINITKELKKSGAFVRVNTNGQANLIHSRDIVKDLSGLVDAVSISLNASNENEYQSLCRSQFGKAAYNSIKEFILECKKYIPQVTVTIVTVPNIDIKECKHVIENELGVKLKIREYGRVG